MTSLGISKVPAADPGKKLNFNILGEIWSNLRVMKADRDLWRANWGNTAFFFVATLVQINLALFAQKVFHLKPTEQAWLQAALSLGIGAGSGLAGKLSSGRIEYGLIPPGAGLMALAGLWLGWPGISKPEFTVGLALFGHYLASPRRSRGTLGLPSARPSGPGGRQAQGAEKGVESPLV
jgi:hypothetical protein